MRTGLCYLQQIIITSPRNSVLQIDESEIVPYNSTVIESKPRTRTALEISDNSKEKLFPNAGLAKDVVETLRKKGLFLTAMESCTGGGLANEITNISGASNVIKGSFVAYSNEQKIALGVPKEIIDTHTVYSLETAEAMAKAALEKSIQADISVGITGSITRKDPNNDNSVPGEVYIAIASHEAVTSQAFIFTQGDRSEIKDQAIGEALQMILSVVDADDQDTAIKQLAVTSNW